MTTGRKIVSIVGLAAALALTISGCAATGAVVAGGSSKGTLGLSFGGADIEYWNDVSAIAAEQAAERGYELLVDDPQWDVQRQITDWQAWRTRGVKAIMAYPIQTDALVPVTDELIGAGIPVLGYTTQWGDVEYSLISDPKENGLTTGAAVAEWLTTTFGDAPVRVALLNDREQDLGRLRTEGLIEALEAAVPNVTIDELPGLTRQDGADNAERQLTAHPDTVAWVSVGNDNAHAAYQVLLDNGVSPTDPNVLIASMDSTNETIDLLAANDGQGIYRFSFIFPAETMATHITDMLIDAAEGNEMETITIDPVELTAANAREYYIQR